MSLTEGELKWYGSHPGPERPEDCTWTLGERSTPNDTRIGYGGLDERGEPLVVIHQGSQRILLRAYQADIATRYIGDAASQAIEIAVRAQHCPDCNCEKSI